MLFSHLNVYEEINSAAQSGWMREVGGDVSVATKVTSTSFAGVVPILVSNVSAFPSLTRCCFFMMSIRVLKTATPLTAGCVAHVIIGLVLIEYHWVVLDCCYNLSISFVGPSFHALICSHSYALCEVCVESTLCVVVPPLTGDWTPTDGQRLEAAVQVCISNSQGWAQSSVSMCKALGFIPSSEKRERRGRTTKRLRARVVDGIVCPVAQCGRFVVGAL